MAISKIKHMKDTGTSYHGRHLKKSIEYITVSEKTQNGRLVSAINCQVDYAYEQMKQTKEKFGKNDKRQGYHIILAFKEGEANADIVFEITRQFVNEYLGKDYEAIYAVHDNTDHVHSHIVFNSVSFRTGRKYRYEKGDWAKYIQPITNRLCKEYNLSTINIEDGSKEKDANTNYEEWNEYRDGKFVWSDMIKRDIDACIIKATSFKEFTLLMQDKGYEIKNSNGEGKYLAIKPQGMNRFRRCKSLGEDYSEEQIRKRIITESITVVDEMDDMKQSQAKIIYCKAPRPRKAKVTNLQAKYYMKMYRIGKLKKKPYSEAWKYRNDIRKMQKLQKQYLFLVRHDIKSVLDLVLVNNNLNNVKKKVYKEKSKIYKARAKCKELFDIADEMKEIEICEKCYRDGKKDFEEEHIEWIRLENKLKEQGYSYEEVESLREYYRCEASDVKSRETYIRRELRIAESVINDYIADNPDTRKEDLMEMIDLKALEEIAALEEERRLKEEVQQSEERQQELAEEQYNKEQQIRKNQPRL